MTITDTPRTDACPHCGAEAFELPVEGYTCGTEPWYDEVIGSCLVRSNICYSNENTQLLSELSASLAEVERLTKRPFGCKCETFREKALGEGCEECNKAFVIEMLTDERDELDAEVESLREKLDTAIEIAKDALWYARIYENEIHFNKMDVLYQKLVALKNK
jgi:hypothetical protein